MSLQLVHSGKVRELYDAGDDRLLMVASDRISAFDVVLAEPIPDKGRVLTAMTVHFLGELADLAPSHLITADPDELPAEAASLGGEAGGLGLHRHLRLDEVGKDVEWCPACIGARQR